MKTTVGLFSSPADAATAIYGLRESGIPPDRINLLTPGSAATRGDVPTTDTEQPGMGTAVGGVVGGAVGAAGGMAAAAAATAFVPGVGPVIAIGLVAGALLGLGGAAVGNALEDSMSGGVPKDELFLYQDALRRGRTVVIALAEDDAQAETARRVLREAGAESLDAARERWWVGLRSAEAERYAGEGLDFARDEAVFRRGFEAALQPETQGREYEDVVEYLRAGYPDVYGENAFQRGYERGRAYCLGLRAAA